MNNRPFLYPAHETPTRRICMLMVTHSCNLNCDYCYESHKDSQMMSLEQAQKIINKEFEFVVKSPTYNEIQIDFMGGEPLMNFHVIREIVEWLESTQTPVPWICFASTNGTLLDKERRNWFRVHKNSIWLGASYDGTEQLQETNRHTVNTDVDLSFFHELWPSQSLHMTVSKRTLPQMSEGVCHLLKKGFLLEVALAQGEEWTRDDALLFQDQLTIVGEAYVRGEIPEIINLLKRNLYSIGVLEHRTTQRKYCGTGTGMITYDIDGRTYGCHMFTPLVLGEKMALELRNQNWSNDLVPLDEQCRDCVLGEFCSTCMGFNYRYRGALGRKDMRFCLMNLAMVKAACSFQAKVLAQVNSFSKTEAEFAKGVLSAAPILSRFDCESSEAPFIVDRNVIRQERR